MNANRFVCAVLAGAAALSSVVLAPHARASVVIHWKLDESSGNTANDSAAGVGGAQNGTSGVAAPQWQPAGGILGGALRFSATSQTDTDENVTFTSGTNIIANYPITLASWVKTTETSGARSTFVFFGDHLDGAKYLQNSRQATSNRASAGARNTAGLNEATNTASISNDAWHHVVGVYNSATSRVVYVDGVQTGSNATSTAIFNTTRFSLGALMRGGAGPTDSYNGLLDDAALWDEAVAPTRIALLNGLGRFASVSLDDASIPLVETVFNSQSGTAISGPYNWEYATGLPSTTVGATGTIGSDAYIVLGNTGTGVRGVPVPEPAGAGLLCAAAGLLASRRRRKDVRG